MTTVTFRELKLYGTKTGKCGCGKQRKRQHKFTQTLNPWNLNTSGDTKTSTEIYDELHQRLEEWKKQPITCEKCEGAAKADEMGRLRP